MDIDALFSVHSVLQSLTVGIIVCFIRLWLESNWTSLISNKKFTGLILPSLALVISLTFSFLIPFDLNQRLPDKISYGLICGFSSSFIFSALKSFLKKQAGLSDSIFPGELK